MRHAADIPAACRCFLSARHAHGRRPGDALAVSWLRPSDPCVGTSRPRATSRRRAAGALAVSWLRPSDPCVGTSRPRTTSRRRAAGALAASWLRPSGSECRDVSPSSNAAATRCRWGSGLSRRSPVIRARGSFSPATRCRRPGRVRADPAVYTSRPRATSRPRTTSRRRAAGALAVSWLRPSGSMRRHVSPSNDVTATRCRRPGRVLVASVRIQPSTRHAHGRRPGWALAHRRRLWYDTDVFGNAEMGSEHPITRNTKKHLHPVQSVYLSR